jgi:hypothetical protein
MLQAFKFVASSPSPDTSPEFSRFIASEIAKYARIVKAWGAKVD